MESLDIASSGNGDFHPNTVQPFRIWIPIGIVVHRKIECVVSNGKSGIQHHGGRQRVQVLITSLFCQDVKVLF